MLLLHNPCRDAHPCRCAIHTHCCTTYNVAPHLLAVPAGPWPRWPGLAALASCSYVVRYSSTRPCKVGGRRERRWEMHRALARCNAHADTLPHHPSPFLSPPLFRSPSSAHPAHPAHSAGAPAHRASARNRKHYSERGRLAGRSDGLRPGWPPGRLARTKHTADET